MACLHEDEMEYLDEEVFFLSIDCPQCYAENSPSLEIKKTKQTNFQMFEEAFWKVLENIKW